MTDQATKELALVNRLRSLENALERDGYSDRAAIVHDAINKIAQQGIDLMKFQTASGEGGG